MKEIYFACSIRGGRDDAASYAELVEHIKTRAIVLTEIFADGTLTPAGMNKPSDEIWKTDTDCKAGRRDDSGSLEPQLGRRI